MSEQVRRIVEAYSNGYDDGIHRAIVESRMVGDLDALVDRLEELLTERRGYVEFDE